MPKFKEEELYRCIYGFGRISERVEFEIEFKLKDIDLSLYITPADDDPYYYRFYDINQEMIKILNEKYSIILPENLDYTFECFTRNKK